MTRQPGTRRLTSAIITLAIAGMCVVALAQTVLLSPILISVNPEEQTTLGHSNPKSTAPPETRTEKLDVTLMNATPHAWSNLTVRCVIFTQDVQDHKISVALNKDKKINLPAGGLLTVTSEVASITYTPQHELISKSKPARRGSLEAVHETPIKASGKMFAGYGVQLLQTNALLGQLFSPAILTNQLPLITAAHNKAGQPQKH